MKIKVQEWNYYLKYSQTMEGFRQSCGGTCPFKMAC